MLALDGIRVVDLTRIGPGPYCSMLLGDFGAEVIVIERPDLPAEGGEDASLSAAMATRRNKRFIALDLKAPRGREIALALIARADVVLEGFRPGVAERLGLGADALRSKHPRLVYCSISGYGQTGPKRLRAGHDINYIAAAGALSMIGNEHGPAVPMNFVADYAGGALPAAFAIAMALYRREKSGGGDTIDVSMTDGVVSLLAKRFGLYQATGHLPRAGRDPINGARPHYTTYRCADGRYLAVGPLEPALYANLCRALGLDTLIAAHDDPARADAVRRAFAERFATQSAAAWAAELEGADGCVEAVRDLGELDGDPQLMAREMFVDVPSHHGVARQVGVAPKLAEGGGRTPRAGGPHGADGAAIVAELGYDAEQLVREGILSVP